MNTPRAHAQLADGVASAGHWLLPGTQVSEFAENGDFDDLTKTRIPLGAIDPDGS